MNRNRRGWARECRIVVPWRSDQNRQGAASGNVNVKASAGGEWGQELVNKQARILGWVLRQADGKKDAFASVGGVLLDGDGIPGR